MQINRYTLASVVATVTMVVLTVALAAWAPPESLAGPGKADKVAVLPPQAR